MKRWFAMGHLFIRHLVTSKSYGFLFYRFIYVTQYLFCIINNSVFDDVLPLEIFNKHVSVIEGT